MRSSRSIPNTYTPAVGTGIFNSCGLHYGQGLQASDRLEMMRDQKCSASVLGICVFLEVCRPPNPGDNDKEEAVSRLPYTQLRKVSRWQAVARDVKRL